MGGCGRCARVIGSFRGGRAAWPVHSDEEDVLLATAGACTDKGVLAPAAVPPVAAVWLQRRLLPRHSPVVVAVWVVPHLFGGRLVQWGSLPRFGHGPTGTQAPWGISAPAGC